MAEDKSEKKPNIIITGTPGVGKSFICAKLAEQLKFKWWDVSKIAKEKNFIEEHDEEYDCPILDEEKLMDFLEPAIEEGGNIVEYHVCEFFPECWFQAVFVVTCDNTILYDRLKARGYNEKKLKSNIQCEIFKTIQDIARQFYNTDIVFVLKGETAQDAENSMKTVRNWYRAWKRK